MYINNAIEVRDLSRDKTIPLYFRVAETLRGRIANQVYRAGSVLPSEKQLAKEFGVSLITIRKAMELLVREDLVTRKRGVGTTVSASNHGRLPIKLSGNFRDWFDSVSGKLQGLEAQVLEMGVVDCPERVARALGIPEGSAIWRMKRVRRFRGEAISYYVNYAPKELVELVKPSDFEKRSFLEVFQERFGVKLVRLEQMVEATVADMDVANILGVEFGAPLFFVENIYYTRKGCPIEVTHMFYRGDRYVYRASIPMIPEGC